MFKGKKGLLFGLIGVGVLIAILVVVLFFVFCGSDIEPGMSEVEFKEAMLDAGFKEDSVSGGYAGNVEGVGKVQVNYGFEDEKLAMIILTSENSDALESYLKERYEWERVPGNLFDFYMYDDGEVVGIMMLGMTSFFFTEYVDADMLETVEMYRSMK